MSLILVSTCLKLMYRKGLMVLRCLLRQSPLEREESPAAMQGVERGRGGRAHASLLPAGALRRRAAGSQERRGPQGRKGAGQETARPQESSCGREEVALFSFRPSVQLSCSVVSDSLKPHGLQHARPPCPSPTPGACSNPCPLSR